MKVTQMVGELYCTTCHAETVHQITYLNNSIQKIDCLGCQQHIGSDINFKEELYVDLVNRFSSKPYRLVKEVNNHTIKTISKLPFRMIQKPYSLAQEMLQTRSDFKKIKHL